MEITPEDKGTRNKETLIYTGDQKLEIDEQGNVTNEEDKELDEQFPGENQ